MRFFLLLFSFFITTISSFGAVVKVILVGFQTHSDSLVIKFAEAIKADSTFGPRHWALVSDTSYFLVETPYEVVCNADLFRANKKIAITPSFILSVDTTTIKFDASSTAAAVINDQDGMYQMNRFVYLDIPRMVSSSDKFYYGYARRKYYIDTAYDVMLAFRYAEYERNVLNSIRANRNYAFNVMALYNTREDLTTATLDSAYAILPIRYQQSLHGNRLKKYMATRKRLSAGMVIPELTIMDSTGVKMPLSTVDWKSKKYWVVATWASWCAPCLAALKKLDAVYEPLNQAGIGVITISVDDEKARWEKAYRSRNFKWKDYWSPTGYTPEFRDLFGIYFLPFDMLLDNTGRIVKYPVSLEEVEKIKTELGASK